MNKNELIDALENYVAFVKTEIAKPIAPKLDAKGYVIQGQEFNPLSSMLDTAIIGLENNIDELKTQKNYDARFLMFNFGGVSALVEEGGEFLEEIMDIDSDKYNEYTDLQCEVHTCMPKVFIGG